MKKIYKNLSPDLKSFNSNSLNNQNSQLSKLIEETILEFNIKYNSINNMLNQIKKKRNKSKFQIIKFRREKNFKY